MNSSSPVSAEAAAPAPPRTRRGRAIQQALPILGSAVARQCGVEVVFGGSPNRVGKQIHLPNLLFDDPDTEVLALGYLLHEAAHIRYQEGEAVTTSVLQESLRKLLQDPVDERKLGRDYPGFKYRLQQLVERLVQNGEFAPPRAEDSSAVKLEKYLLYRLRAVMVGQTALAEYAAQAEAIFRESFPPGACVRIGSVIGRVPTLNTRQDVADLAQEIVEIIREESQDPPLPPLSGGSCDSPAPASPQGASGASSADGGGASSGGTDQGAAQGAAAPEASEPAAGADANASASAAGGSTSCSESAPASAGVDADRRTNLRSLLDATEQDFSPELGQVLSEALYDQAQRALAQGGSGAGIGRATMSLVAPDVDPVVALAEVQEATIALRTRLSSLVESSRQERGDHARHGARIDPRRYVRAMCGDPRIFRSQREQRAVNTRIVWLVDRSSSMRAGGRMTIARQSVLAAAATVETIPGLEQTVAVFPGHGAEVEVVTAASESVKRTAARYLGIEPSGGTPLLQALLWAVDQLLAAPEPRKLIMVVTDGKPVQPELCREAIERCWNGGIEAYGIGIRVPDIRELFEKSRCIDELSELAPAIFGLLEEVLTRGMS